MLCLYHGLSLISEYQIRANTDLHMLYKQTYVNEQTMNSCLFAETLS